MKLPFGLGKNVGDGESATDKDTTGGSAAASAQLGNDDAAGATEPRTAAGRSADETGTETRSETRTQAFPAPAGQRATPQSIGVQKPASRWSRGREGTEDSVPATADAGTATQAIPREEMPVAPSAASDTAAAEAPAPTATDATTEAARPPFLRPRSGAQAAESTAAPTDRPTDSTGRTEDPDTQRSVSSGEGGEGSRPGGHAGALAAGGAAAGAGLGAAAVHRGNAPAGSDQPPAHGTEAPATERSTVADAPATTPHHDEGTSAMQPQYGAENATTAFPTAAHDYADAPYTHDEYADDATAVGAGAVGARTATEKPRRGTADLGLFLLRIVVGALLGLHALRIVFGLFGGPGIDGMSEVLLSAGFDSATTPLTYVYGIAALVGAVLLILGFATPFAAGVLLGFVGVGALMALGAPGSSTILGGSDLSGASGNGLELHILYAVALVALLFAGGGKWGLDAGRRWAAAPRWSGFVWIVVAVVVVGLIWYFLNGTNPLGAGSA